MGAWRGCAAGRATVHTMSGSYLAVDYPCDDVAAMCARIASLVGYLQFVQLRRAGTAGAYSSQHRRHAAMPRSLRMGTGAHCMLRCANSTNSTPPPASGMAARRLQHSTETPGGKVLTV